MRQFPPVHHTVAGVVVADNMLIRVVILADDRQLLHVEAALLEFANSVFSLAVRFINSYDGVLFGHVWVPHLEILVWKKVTLTSCLCPCAGPGSILPMANPPAHVPRLRGLPLGLGLTLRLRGLPFGLGLTLRLRGLPLSLRLRSRCLGCCCGCGLGWSSGIRFTVRCCG